MSGFHRTFATSAACQQRTLTTPDTWSCPLWDSQMFFCWDHRHAIVHNTSLWHLSLTWHFTDFDVLLLNIGFHRASVTRVACPQGTLTPPYTWSCPTFGLANVLIMRPIYPELVLFPGFFFWVSNIPRYFWFALDIVFLHVCVNDFIPFWTCICSTCWDQSFSELVVILPDYALRISLGSFSIFL